MPEDNLPQPAESAQPKGGSQVVTKETVSKESVQERDSRLKREEQKQEYELREKEAAARHQRLLEKILVLVLIIFSLTIGAFCLYVSLSTRFSQDEKIWARSSLGTIIGAIAGFFTGKSMTKSNTS